MAWAIKVEGLSKEYRIGGNAAGSLLVERLSSIVRHPLGFLRDEVSRGKAGWFWALKDLDFEIEQGAVVGVVGRNGAGKSTLLKILSRITEPTSGRAVVRGRIASLLEVGTGFHPELTGRENVFLNATILGMRRREIERKFDEIVAFSGVERFLDMPVKHYSSGMYVRLAFAVAAHVEADILLVDEVLAVGDAEFQKRCLGRMGEVARSGETIIYVSHALESVRRLCSRAIWIDGGRIESNGPTDSVLQAYATPSASSGTTWIPDRARSDVVQILGLHVLGSATEEGELLSSEPIVACIDYVVSRQVQGRIAIAIHDEYGQTVFTTASTDSSNALNEAFVAGRFTSECTVRANLLAPGQYSLSVAVPDPQSEGFHRTYEGIASFRVSGIGSLVARDGRRGIIVPLLEWRTRSVNGNGNE